MGLMRHSGPDMTKEARHRIIDAQAWGPDYVACANGLVLPEDIAEKR